MHSESSLRIWHHKREAVSHKIILNIGIISYIKLELTKLTPSGNSCLHLNNRLQRKAWVSTISCPQWSLSTDKRWNVKWFRTFQIPIEYALSENCIFISPKQYIFLMIEGVDSTTRRRPLLVMFSCERSIVLKAPKSAKQSSYCDNCPFIPKLPQM